MAAVYTIGVRCSDAAESSQVTPGQSDSHITATTTGKPYRSISLAAVNSA
jgi:hypothetical protein